MYTSYFWHKFHLYRKEIAALCVCLSLLISGFQSYAQRASLYSVHQPEYDERPLHYGFFLAGNYTKFNRKYSQAFVNGTDTAYAINPAGAPGFGLGFIASYIVSNHFEVRVLPSAAFYERSISYRFARGTETEQRIESTFLELPLLVKYRSNRRGNVRMYMVGGLKPSLEIGSNRKERSQDRLRTDNMDLTVEYGFGFDLFYSFVKVSPELRFSHGIRNMLIPDTSPYSRSIDRLNSHTVSLSLFFE
jgi:hypothetical protein